MAKIEKESQKFLKSYQLGQQHLWRVAVPDGHGGQIRKQGFIEKSDALKYATSKYLEVLKCHKGVKSFDSTLTFSEYSKQWLQMKRRSDLCEAAFMRYEQEVRERLTPFFGSVKMNDIEKYHLRKYIAEIQESETGSSAVRYSVTVFKAIIKQAEIDDLIPSKGITLMQTPRHKRKAPRFLDQKELQYFLNAVKGHELYDLWALTLFTGLRAGEVAGLKWDSIRFDWSFGSYTGAIEIKRSYNQKTRVMQETTKNGERRVVPILPQVREILERRFRNRKGDFVFGNDAPLESSHFNRQLQAVLKKLPREQVPMITFHSLRHSFCSYLDATGMSRRIVAEIMGHRDLNTTNRYSHVNNQMLGHEVQRWLQGQIQQKTNKLEVVNF